LREMTPADKERVVAELRRLGFRHVNRRDLDGPYAKKLQALWIAAWNLGLTRSRDDKALLAFVKRQTGLDH
ncbi:phage protein GemA/Gp16 family protein, partial [Salmonella enterica]|uniref:phage protein GemA/Gp16 family protein n=1 Tax=Salmonella enterica TaxID=28901 RepID=UPI003CFB0B88